MSTNEDEPPVKRQRQPLRTLKIDPNNDKLSPWVQTASDEKLMKVFQIGMLVYDSISMQENYKQEFFDSSRIDQLIEEKLNPKGMAEEVDILSEKVFRNIDNVKQQTKDMEKDINAVLSRTLAPTLIRCKKKLQDISTSHNKAGKQDATSEKRQLMEVVESQISKTHVVTKIPVTVSAALMSRTGSSNERGRYLVQSRQNSQARFLMEVLQGGESSVETEQFEKFVKEKPSYKAGILIAASSGITKRVIGKRFEIMFMDGKYFIYLPNAVKDQHLILWAVFMADELVALNQDLGNEQRKKLHSLYKEFEKNIKTCQNCTDDLAVLRKSADDLEKNLIPLSEIARAAQEKLKKVLGMNSPVPPTRISHDDHDSNLDRIIID